MYHSITFEKGESSTKNTWSNWHLIPVSPPYVSPPKLNEKMIDVPGRDGMLDLTTVLTGTPTFGNRSGSWEFYVILDGWERKNKKDVFTVYWKNGLEAYSTLLQYFKGAVFKVYLEDEDYQYYYSGRISVSSFTPGKETKITLSYNLDPYRINTTTGDKVL